MDLNNILNALEAEEQHDDSVICVIDDNMRIITVPSAGLVFGVEHDKDVNKVTFEMDRYYRDNDMSEFIARVVYQNANGDKNYTAVTDLTFTEDKITFSWIVPAYALLYEGNLIFAVTFLKTVDGTIVKALNTTTTTAKCLSGLQVDELIPEEELKDYIETIKSDIKAFSDKELSTIKETSEEAVSAINSAGSTNLETINSTSSSKLSEITSTATSKISEINRTADTRLSEITTTSDEKLDAIVNTSATKLSEITSAADEKLSEIEKADFYKKQESDDRYAPIESALTVSGSGDDIVTLSPTVQWKLRNFKLYGKTNQNGTPSSENKIPLESSGSSGHIFLYTIGKNLFNSVGAYKFENGYEIGGVTATILEDGSLKFNGVQDGSINSDFYFNLDQFNNLVDGYYALTAFADFGSTENISIYYNALNGFFQGSNGQPCIFEKTKQGTIKYVIIRLGKNISFDNVQIKLCLTVGKNVPDQFVSYIGSSSANISTPDGLPGLYTDSGGNYTDKNGKHWISDIIDLEAKTRTNNIFVKKIADFTKANVGSSKNGYTEGYILSGNVSSYEYAASAICDKFVYAAMGLIERFAISGAYVYFTIEGELSSDEWKAKMNEIQPTIAYVLKTPVVTSLTDEEIAAYKALTSYKGTTNIIAEGCGVEATAVADSNAIIKNLEEKINSIGAIALGGNL